MKSSRKELGTRALQISMKTSLIHRYTNIYVVFKERKQGSHSDVHQRGNSRQDKTREGKDGEGNAQSIEIFWHRKEDVEGNVFTLCSIEADALGFGF